MIKSISFIPQADGTVEIVIDTGDGVETFKTDHPMMSSAWADYVHDTRTWIEQL